MDKTKQDLKDLKDYIHGELSIPLSDDPILECEADVLSNLQQNPNEVRRLADDKLHVFPFKDVRDCWRRLYTDASLWEIVQLEEEGDWATTVVKTLDMTLIMTGAPLRQSLIEKLFQMLEDILEADSSGLSSNAASTKVDLNGDTPRQTKRRKLNNTGPNTFPKPTVVFPPLIHPISRLSNPSLSAFQIRLASDHRANKHLGPLPMIITGALTPWPALDSSSNRFWDSPDYLLKKTLGGRRLVPVEIGRSYTDESWGQQIITFGEFIEKYMLQGQHKGQEDRVEGNEKNERNTGYLAQHDLFAQIPSLRNDIAIPDYCYSVPPSPSPSPSPHTTSTQSKPLQNPTDLSSTDPDAEPDPPSSEVLLNAWFGPQNTTSPLHTDPHHNILAQAVGKKYIRLYAPSQTSSLYPRGVDEHTGVDMSNTSQIDIEFVMRYLECRSFGALDTEDDEGDDINARKWAFEQEFPDFAEAVYVEGILEEGECLFIPKGWWHYVRSLSPSFSVSFWWD
jgi:hypothetical protein